MHADEAAAERAAHARKQLREYTVDVGVAGRLTHSWVKSG